MSKDLAGHDSTCRKCGEPVLTFNDGMFGDIHLEGNNIPINADLAQLASDYRIWQYLGPNVGWVNKPLRDRTWRPIRASHRCPGENRPALAGHTDNRPVSGGGKQQHKNKKENPS